MTDEQFRATIEALENKVERLRTIVDKLPKTADGVPVTSFCQTLYTREGVPVSVSGNRTEQYYSTKEAAEAAKTEGVSNENPAL